MNATRHHYRQKNVVGMNTAKLVSFAVKVLVEIIADWIVKYQDRGE